MIIISGIKTTDKDNNPTLNPSKPFPANTIAIVCDGVQYKVYQPGDVVPQT